MSMNLASITENASRLGMRLTESISEHTRDLVITRGSNSLYLDASDERFKNLAKQLDSSSDREKLDAMKRLIALVSKGRNVSEYFAQVVKNVASQNLEIRKLVYIYLLRYAEHEPDLVLLSINTFQKDLTDSNPLIRAMALRVLSGIKVPMIGNIVVLAIKRCAADISPYVRKAAALAIPKCYQLDPSHASDLIGITTSLLRDRSPLSIGSVAVAFDAICPTQLSLLHSHYRRLCRVLVDVDEWGQVNLLGLLLRYARTMLSRPKSLTGDEPHSEDVDCDLQLLLTSSEPLLQSRNPAVVLAVVRVFYYAGPISMMSRTLHPLLRLLHVAREVERVTMSYLVVLSVSLPSLFCSLFPRFLIRADDLPQVKRDKVRLLLNIMTVENQQAILQEFVEYANDVDEQLVSYSIQAIAKCAQRIPDCTAQCLNALMVMFRSQRDVVVSNTIMVLKALIQNQFHSMATVTSASHSPTAIISHLAHSIEDIRHAQAKACAVWLVGQYSQDASGGVVKWAPDVLRKCVRSFVDEATLVRLQVVTLAAKLLTLAPDDHTIGLLSRYVFSLARYDQDYDVRDRARMLTTLLAGLAPTITDVDTTAEKAAVVLRKQQVEVVLFDGKANVVEPIQCADHDSSPLGSLSGFFGTRTDLPDWLEQGIEPSLRHTEDDHSSPAQPVIPLATRRAFESSTPGTPGSHIPAEGTSPTQPAIRNGQSNDDWTDLDRFYEDSDQEDAESGGSEGDGSDTTGGRKHASVEGSEDSCEEVDSEDEAHWSVAAQIENVQS